MSKKCIEFFKNYEGKKPFVIAIDGLTASGKGTLAESISTTLGFSHMDTGALYRGVGKTALDQGFKTQDENQAARAAELFRQNYTPDIQYDPAIRTETVSIAASEVAYFDKVRHILLQLQKEFARQEGETGIVMDGRDIGTIICPEADIKFFVTADEKIRAKRRMSQIQEKGHHATFEDVLKELQIRDGRDITRKTAPTLAAKDAIVLDTTTINPEETLEEALLHIERLVLL